VYKNLSIGVLALLLAACALVKVPSSRRRDRRTHFEPGLPPAGLSHLWKPMELRSCVPGGPLALRHTSHGQSTIRRRGQPGGRPSESVFRLTVPVAGFVVDDPRRREEGRIFAGDIPDDANQDLAQLI